MTDLQKPPLVVPLLSALFALFGLPLGVALFASRTDDVASAWNEGGWPLYPVLLLAMVVTLTGAVGVFFAARGKPMFWAVSASFSVLVFGAGLVGYRSGLVGSFVAVTHAAPEDRMPIMNGAVSEATWCVVLPMALLAGLFVAQGLALALSAIASTGSPLPRRGRALIGFGVLSLGVWQALSAFALNAEREVYSAVAHASPGDRLFLITGFLEEHRAWQRLVPLALLATVVLCVLAGILLRSNTPVLLSSVAGILLPMVGLGALQAFAKPDADEAALVARPRTTKPLLVLDATPTNGPYPYVTLGTQLLDEQGQPLELEQVDPTRTFELGLEPDVTMAALEATLGRLRALGVNSVLLLGTMTVKPEGLDVPSRFAQHFTESRGVRVLLGRTGVECPPGGCVFAELTDSTLSWGDARWPLTSKPFDSDTGQVNFESAVPFKLEGHTLTQFLSAAMSVAAQDPRRLAVYFDEAPQ